MKTPELPTKIYFTILDMGSGYVYTPSLDDNGGTEYIRKDALMEWVESEMNRLWELLPDADNPNPTQMELRYLGQYMQMEALEDKLNSM